MATSGDDLFSSFSLFGLSGSSGLSRSFRSFSWFGLFGAKVFDEAGIILAVLFACS
jgi:hypothetical protein